MDDQRALPAPDPASELTKAVIYLRVSTKEQADREGDPEGYSIPAQREANHRKAQSLGAVVLGEFVDRGESARSADRPQLQALLRYVAENSVDFVIVHKVDRLARNRVDDIEINLALQRAGCRLISATESIDETPSGMLLHGIMSSIAEFYSRNLANEVLKGMGQKAKSGGTPSMAPIGYLNVRARSDEGREIRTIAVDPERAPLVRWAYEAYATGDWSVEQVRDELERRGLTSRPTPKRPAKALRTNQVHRLLRSPYYKGSVIWQGAEHPGRHEAIVDPITWQKVQETLTGRRTGEKQRDHLHYLKSSVFCGDCGSRLIITMAKNRYGTVYPYFVCSGRHEKRNGCLFKAVLISTVERLIEQEYEREHITEAERADLERMLVEQLMPMREETESERASLVSSLAKAKAQQKKLLDAYYAGAVPLDLMKIEQDRLNGLVADIEERLGRLMADFDRVQRGLEQALQLLRDCATAYGAADDHIRRRMNQALFTAFHVFEDRVEAELAAPYSILKAAQVVAPVAPKQEVGAPRQVGLDLLIERELVRRQRFSRQTHTNLCLREGSRENHLVPPLGLEPRLRRF